MYWTKTYIMGCLIMMLFHLNSFAQQDPQFTQYMFSKPFFNPAAVGMTSDQMEATLLHRTQWLGYEGTFDDNGTLNTQYFALNSPIQSKRLGVGFYVVNDDVGLMSNLEAQVSVSYFLQRGGNRRYLVLKTTLNIGVLNGGD